MPFLLRIFRSKSLLDGAQEWVDASSVGDAIRIFQEANNEVSLFRLNEPNDAPRAVAAVLLSRPRDLQAKAFVIVNEEQLQWISAKLVADLGATPDDTVNDWHLNLVNATTAELAEVTFRFGRWGSVEKWNLATAINEARRSLAQNWADRSRVNQQLLRRHGL